MPFFSGNPSIAAGATIDLLNNTVAPARPWKYNRAPYDGICEVMIRSVGTPATALRQQITVGSDEVQQDSLVSAGGVAQNLPARLATEPVTFSVRQGDVISLVVTNPGVGAIECAFTCELTRKGGG